MVVDYSQIAVAVAGAYAGRQTAKSDFISKTVSSVLKQRKIVFKLSERKRKRANINGFRSFIISVFIGRHQENAASMNIEQQTWKQHTLKDKTRFYRRRSIFGFGFAIVPLS